MRIFFLYLITILHHSLLVRTVADILHNKGVRMKKILIIIPLVLVLILSIRLFNRNKCYGIYLTQSNYMEHKSEKLIDYIDDEDIEGLKSMFCEKNKAECNLDKQIKEALEFIDGDIVSYDRPYGASSEQIRDGKVKMSWVTPGIENILTSKGKKYEIYFDYNIVDGSHLEYIGITQIIINDITDDKNSNKKYVVGKYRE